MINLALQPKQNKVLVSHKFCSKKLAVTQLDVGIITELCFVGQRIIALFVVDLTMMSSLLKPIQQIIISLFRPLFKNKIINEKKFSN